MGASGSAGVRRSLQRRIIASVLLGLGVVLLGLGYLVLLTFGYTREAALQERLALAQDKQHEIDEEIRDALGLLTRLGRVVAPTLQAGDVAAAQAWLQRAVETAERFSAAAIVHPTRGVIAVAGGAPLPRWISSPSALIARTGTGRGVVEADGSPASIALVAPISITGTAGLWLAAELHRSRLERHLTPHDRTLGAYEAEVMSTRGRVAASPGLLRIESKHEALVATLARERRAGVILHGTPNGAHDHYVAYAPLAVLPGWGVIIEQSRDVVVALPVRLRRWMIGIGAFVLLAGALVAWLDVRRVTTPLRALTAAADRIGRRDLATPVDVGGPDEIGLLGRTLEEMRSRLRRSLDEIEARERQAQALLGVSTQILASRDRDAVLEEIAGHARTLLGCEVACICLLETGTGRCRVVASAGAGEICAAMEARADKSTPGDPCDLLTADFLPARQAAPLRAGSETVGWLCAGGQRPAEPAAGRDTLLSGLANLASLAVENARLQEEAQSAATLRERERIARELHDGLAQMLGTLYTTAGSGRTRLARGDTAGVERALREMAGLSGQAYEEVRQSIFGLRTMVSRGLGLIPAVTEYLHEFSERSGIPVRLVVQDDAATHFSPEVETQLIRIVQEALNNVGRHARAREAVVRFGPDDGMAHIVVEDDGVGFDPAATAPPGGRHFGLATMRERAESVGGTLHVHSTPGQGTRVEVRLPLDR
ncbi:MAG: HAMP domain-containing protein [Armatimonadetes bacterium]|nr:HAMP domain-containing protein [Armatimonadota bacterium]